MIQKSTSDCIVGVVIAPEESIECTEREREREREREVSLHCMPLKIIV
jgi:hypothetical protein